MGARARLEQAHDANQTLTDAQRSELAALAEEQGRLADLLLDMVKPDESKPEDSPEKLPDASKRDAGRRSAPRAERLPRRGRAASELPTDVQCERS